MISLYAGFSSSVDFCYFAHQTSEPDQSHLCVFRLQRGDEWLKLVLIADNISQITIRVFLVVYVTRLRICLCSKGPCC